MSALREVLVAHIWADPLEEGMGYQVGWVCRCGLKTREEDHLERGEEWHTAHVEAAMLAWVEERLAEALDPVIRAMYAAGESLDLCHEMADAALDVIRQALTKGQDE